MASIEEMTNEISRLYHEEGFPFKDAREIVIRGSGVSSQYWPMLRTQLSSIHGQRGGKKKKARKGVKFFSDRQIRDMIFQSLEVTMERGDHLLLDP
jgi:hypothetical protein